MPLVFQYLLKLSISLTILYLFYYFVLRRLTFYTYNRWYLLGYSILSFFIAAIDITPFVTNNTPATFTWLQHFPTLQQLSATPLPPGHTSEALAAQAPWGVWDYAVLVFVAGILVLTGRLTIQVLSFRKIKRKASFIPSGDIHVYQVNAPIIPFSFGKNIYINSSLHAPQELEKIIQHEFVHVKQKHTIDIICSEIICFLNWYNPFAWLIRKAVRQNLEYIADDTVLRNGLNKKEYQYLLLKVIGNQKFSIATPFNFSSLKKRIAMMNKLKTSKVHVLKFLFLLPLMASVLLAFRSKMSEPENNSAYTYGGMIINNESGQPMANVKVKELNSGASVVTDQNGFFSFTITDKVIDHKLSLNGSSSPVQFSYSHNGDDNKSFLVLVKAAQQGQTFNVLSSSIAMEWDGSLEQAITTRKNYAAQPAVTQNTETVTQGNIRAEANGGVVGWSGNKPDGDMFIKADTINIIMNEPKGLFIYNDKMYTARDYKEQLAGKILVKQVYFFSKENSKRIWGNSDGVIMINDNPSFKQYASGLTDTVPGQKKPEQKKSTNRDIDEQVEEGRAAHDSFLKRHPEVTGISWLNSNQKAKHSENGKVISNTNDKETHIKLNLKNGTTENYNLNSDSDLKRFKDKYGELPVQAPPPPMPPTPATPGKVTLAAPATPSAPPATPKKLNLSAPTPPPPPPTPVIQNISLSPVKTETVTLTDIKTNLEEVKIVNVKPIVKEGTIVDIKPTLQEVKIMPQKTVVEEVKVLDIKPVNKVETREKLTLREVKVEKIKSKE